MSSDSTGEIYVVTREDGSGVADVSQVENDGGNDGESTPTDSEDGPSPSESDSAAGRWTAGSSMYWVAGALAVRAIVW